MGLVNLKEMSKRLKMKEEEVEKLVELEVIKPPAYCYPAHFGDGNSIAFFPEQVIEQVKTAKSKPKPEPEPEPEPEAPEEEETVGEEPEMPVVTTKVEDIEMPDPEKPKGKEKGKKAGKK